MDFARKQLEKYGWKEGEGLGKHKTGISKALKPKLKFDTSGLGHDFFDINNTWWQRLYDEASKNIVAKTDGDSVTIKTVNESVEITKKKKKSKNRGKSQETVYNGFFQTSGLNHNGEGKVVEDEEEEPEVKKKKVSSGICDLTDEELFKICGGRTVHKGARHGLKMNAKLARIEEQERSLMQKEVENAEEPEIIKSVKCKSHKKKHKKLLQYKF